MDNKELETKIGEIEAMVDTLNQDDKQMLELRLSGLVERLKHILATESAVSRGATVRIIR